MYENGLTFIKCFPSHTYQAKCSSHVQPNTRTAFDSMNLKCLNYITYSVRRHRKDHAKSYTKRPSP